MSGRTIVGPNGVIVNEPIEEGVGESGAAYNGNSEEDDEEDDGDQDAMYK